MHNSGSSLLKLAKAVALLAYASEPAWDEEYDAACIGASRVLVREGFFAEAVQCAYSAATSHSNTNKRPAIRNLRNICKQIFEKGGFADDAVAKAVLEKLTSGAAWRSYSDTVWEKGIVSDWKSYASGLVEEGRADLVKPIALEARKPHTTMPNRPLQNAGRAVLARIGKLTPVSAAA